MAYMASGYERGHPPFCYLYFMVVRAIQRPTVVSRTASKSPAGSWIHDDPMMIHADSWPWASLVP